MVLLSGSPTPDLQRLGGVHVVEADICAIARRLLGPLEHMEFYSSAVNNGGLSLTNNDGINIQTSLERRLSPAMATDKTPQSKQKKQLQNSTHSHHHTVYPSPTISSNQLPAAPAMMAIC